MQRLERRGELLGEGCGSGFDEGVVEVARVGGDDDRVESAVVAAGAQALGCVLACRVVIAGDEHAGDAGRWRERAQACGRERGGDGEAGPGGEQRERGLDPLGDDERVGTALPEVHGAPKNSPERLAAVSDFGLGGAAGVEIGALNTDKISRGVDDGGDERGERAEIFLGVAVIQRWMKTQRGEAAVFNSTRPQISPPGELTMSSMRV